MGDRDIREYLARLQRDRLFRLAICIYGVLAIGYILLDVFFNLPDPLFYSIGIMLTAIFAFLAMIIQA